MVKRSKQIRAPEGLLNEKRLEKRKGKLLPKGKMGPTSFFIKRSSAIRKLQISMNDFRRLCILKGIYPREPEVINVSKDIKQNVFYHVKDIKYLSHEPLLEKFRDISSFMKKVKKRIGVQNIDDAKRLYKNRPIYSLNHLVRERYPSFTDALEDLDDALCLIHLFANLPSNSTSKERDWQNIPAELTVNCSRLCKEWQFYVSKSHSLRKIFVSVKGIYYQVEIVGVAITWVQPHKFAQNLPDSVDFQVMTTFLEFYQCLLGFVLFKLYHSFGLKYPPVIDLKKDNNAEFLTSLRPEQLQDVSPSHTASEMIRAHQAPTPAKPQAQSIASILSKIKFQESSKQEEEEEENAEENSDLEEDNIFKDDDTNKAIKKNEERLRVFRELFKGLTFYISREVPFEPLEFCIQSFGGQALSAISLSPDSPLTGLGITHFVSDRELSAVAPVKLLRDAKTCEFIQPQWVFDSINAQLLLPVQKYSTDADTLPPHLSPFVDDVKENYIPEYREEIDNLKAAAAKSEKIDYEKIHLNTKEQVPEEEEIDEAESEEEVEEDSQKDGALQDKNEVDSLVEEEVELSEADSAEVKEQVFVPALKFTGSKKGFIFKRGKNGTGYYQDVFALRSVDFKAQTPMSNRQRRRLEKDEMQGMGSMVMKKSAKHLYDRMQHGIQKKKEAVEALKRKRNENNSNSYKKTK